MLKLIALLVGVAHAQANLNLYMTFPTLAQAHARSQQACVQYACNGVTTEWWAVVPLTDGTAALEIQNTGIYGKTAVVGPCAVGCGLTPAEQASLKAVFQMGSLLPNPIVYDPAPVQVQP